MSKFAICQHNVLMTDECAECDNAIDTDRINVCKHGKQYWETCKECLIDAVIGGNANTFEYWNKSIVAPLDATIETGDTSFDFSINTVPPSTVGTIEEVRRIISILADTIEEFARLAATAETEHTKLRSDITALAGRL